MIRYDSLFVDVDADNGPMLTRLIDQMIEVVLSQQKRLRVAGG